MPLDEALILVKLKLEDYKRERASKKMASQDSLLSSAPAKSLSGGISSLRGPPVNSGMGELKFLFRLLAEDKQLTVPELDRVISYLQDYRTRLSIAEGGPVHSNSRAGSNVSGVYSPLNLY